MEKEEYERDLHEDGFYDLIHQEKVHKFYRRHCHDISEAEAKWEQKVQGMVKQAECDSLQISKLPVTSTGFRLMDPDSILEHRYTMTLTGPPERCFSERRKVFFLDELAYYSRERAFRTRLKEMREVRRLLNTERQQRLSSLEQLCKSNRNLARKMVSVEEEYYRARNFLGALNTARGRHEAAVESFEEARKERDSASIEVDQLGEVCTVEAANLSELEEDVKELLVWKVKEQAHCRESKGAVEKSQVSKRVRE